MCRRNSATIGFEPLLPTFRATTLTCQHARTACAVVTMLIMVSVPCAHRAAQETFNRSYTELRDRSTREKTAWLEEKAELQESVREHTHRAEVRLGVCRLILTCYCTDAIVP